MQAGNWAWPIKGTCISIAQHKTIVTAINVTCSYSLTSRSCTQLYKGFPWFTGWIWPIMFDFTTVPNGDSGQSGLTLQLFPMETIVTSNLIGQNNPINQWKCFIQLGAEGSQGQPVFRICVVWYKNSIFFYPNPFWYWCLKGFCSNYCGRTPTEKYKNENLKQMISAWFRKM